MSDGRRNSWKTTTVREHKPAMEAQSTRTSHWNPGGGGWNERIMCSRTRGSYIYNMESCNIPILTARFYKDSLGCEFHNDATLKNIPRRNPRNIPKPRGKMSTKNTYRTRHIYTLAAHATLGESDKQTSRRLTSAACTTVHAIFYREIYIYN